MDGSNARTSPSSKQGLRYHRHVDDNSVSLLYALSLEEKRHFAGFLVGLNQGPLALLVDHVGDPDESALVSVGGEVAVE